MPASTESALNRRMLGICGRRGIIPLVHVNTISPQALELELGVICSVRVPRWETIVAGSAMEQDHVAQDTLSVEHAPKELLAELRVYFSCSHRNVISTANRCALWDARDVARFSLRCLTPLKCPLALAFLPYVATFAGG